MKTRAAVLRRAGTPWEITELELDTPKANEVLIRMEAAGLCHSDEHIRAKGMARLPTPRTPGMRPMANRHHIGRAKRRCGARKTMWS
jgi:alcohol dehydrogenase (nicotinoprotein)